MKDFLDVYSKQIIMHNEKYKELLQKKEKIDEKIYLFNQEEDLHSNGESLMMCSESN
jgi:hypothetical protein